MARIKRLIFPLVILLVLFACKGKTEAEQAAPDMAAYIESTEQEPSEPEEPGSLQNYEYSWSDSDEMPNLVIIIDDFGNSAGQLLDDFADLPSEIVFAILPDLRHTDTAAEKAVQKGHEVIIHIPMLAENTSLSPGEKYIAPGMDDREIVTILDDFRKQLPMAIAANNHMGSASTADFATMYRTLKHLDKKGLFFIDSATTSKSAVYTASEELGVFTAKRDIFLDVPDVSDATLASKINSLGKYKGRREPIIIITHCHNREKLEALHKFITQVESMGLSIVSLRDAFEKAIS